MKWHPSEMHWMSHRHTPHAHTIQLHPAHWFQEHPMVGALLLAALIALLLIGLATLLETGIKMDTLNPLN